MGQAKYTGKAAAEDHKFKAGLSNLVRLFFKKKK